METTPQIIEETELVGRRERIEGPVGKARPVEGERTVRVDAYDVERQKGIARAILKDCGFISGDEVRAIVQKIEERWCARCQRLSA